MLELIKDNNYVLLMQNDDHVYLEKDDSILQEGLQLMLNDNNSQFKSMYITHWPEIIKYSGKFQKPLVKDNFIIFKGTRLEATQIMNPALLQFLFITYDWKINHGDRESVRIDDLGDRLEKLFPTLQTIYIPLIGNNK